MRELIEISKKSGDWEASAEKLIPLYKPHIEPFQRADNQFLWPTAPDDKVLDAGSMWGGITIPAAQYHKEVYAVDKTIETLEFLDIRAAQMGFDNIRTVASSLDSLPFPDNFFDHVVLSGVLEWVAVDEDLDLKTQWSKMWMGVKLERNKRYSSDPQEVQLGVLKEMNRVLKPGGSLYLAIENRIGFIYLAGWPDDHMNLPFVCFLPRIIANAITRLLLGCDYRTYVYTIPGLRSLLSAANFQRPHFYGVFPHYIRASYALPLDLVGRTKADIQADSTRVPKFLLQFIPPSMLHHLSPSLISIALKQNSTRRKEPRIIRLLKIAGLLKTDFFNYRVVMLNSRSGNDHTVNYAVYTDGGQTAKYFCKICRHKTSTSILENEAGNLKRLVGEVFKNTDIETHLPQLLFFGKIEGITFLVTNYITGHRASFDFNTRLNKKNLNRMAPEIKSAIAFLVRFQEHTKIRSVDASNYLAPILEKQRQLLKCKGLLTPKTDFCILQLIRRIMDMNGVRLPLCGVHGDYDFFYNIMFGQSGIKVFDFEHFEMEGLPFFDFVTLVFNPILLSHEYAKRKILLDTLLQGTPLLNFVRDSFVMYAELSNIPMDLLTLAPAIVALEQKLNEYPPSRNPNDFPIYIQRSFEALVSLNLKL